MNECCSVPSEPRICHCLAHWHPHRRDAECQQAIRRTLDVGVSFTSKETQQMADVIADLVARVDSQRNAIRAARRQMEMFMEDGERNRLTVALAVLDKAVE